MNATPSKAHKPARPLVPHWECKAGQRVQIVCSPTREGARTVAAALLGAPESVVTVRYLSNR